MVAEPQTEIDLRAAIAQIMRSRSWSRDKMAGQLNVSSITLNGWLMGGESAKAEANAREYLDKYERLRNGATLHPVSERNGRPVEVRTPVVPVPQVATIGTVVTPSGYRDLFPGSQALSCFNGVRLRSGYLLLGDDVLAALKHPGYVRVMVNEDDCTVLFCASSGADRGFTVLPQGKSKTGLKREITGGPIRAWMLEHGYALGNAYKAMPRHGGILIAPDELA